MDPLKIQYSRYNSSYLFLYTRRFMASNMYGNWWGGWVQVYTPHQHVNTAWKTVIKSINLLTFDCSNKDTICSSIKTNMVKKKRFSCVCMLFSHSIYLLILHRIVEFCLLFIKKTLPRVGKITFQLLDKNTFFFEND